MGKIDNMDKIGIWKNGQNQNIFKKNEQNWDISGKIQN